MTRFLLRPIEDLAECLRRQVVEADRRALGLLGLLLGAAVTWWLYVPVHELLHALGCLAAGGEVSELRIAPRYGAAALARLFPFVVPGGEYAGRLTGFDTRGSDLVYLATDLAPYLLSVLVGVPLLRRAAARGPAPVAGAGVVLGLAPLLNLTGDYFEMGSIVATRAAAAAGVAPLAELAPLRSDDLFRLLDGANLTPAHGAIVGAAFVLALLFALLTHAGGGLVARAVGAGAQPSSPA